MTLQSLQPTSTRSSASSQQILTQDIIERFPEELKLCIFAHLNIPDLPRVSLVCRQWQLLSSDSDVWRAVFIRNFPDCKLSVIKDFRQACISRYILFSNPKQEVYPSRIFHNIKKENRLLNMSLFSSSETLLSRSNSAEQGNQITLSVYDLNNGDLINEDEFKIESLSVPFVFNKSLYLGNSKGEIEIFNRDEEGFNCNNTIEGRGVTITSLATDMQMIYSGSRDGTVEVWDIQGKNCVSKKELAGKHTQAITHLACIDKILYSGSRTAGTIITRDLTGEEPIVIKTLEGFGRQLGQNHSIFVQNKLISIVSENGIAAYDLETDREPLIFQGHEEGITGFTCAEKMLISASWRGRIAIWKIDTGERLRVLQHSDIPLTPSKNEVANRMGHFRISSVIYTDRGEICAGYDNFQVIKIWNVNAINAVALEPATDDPVSVPEKSDGNKRCILC